ncbi:hypothetical protein TIFTF001_003387 [Ficus carica]|uniref:ABC transmembrane type-1 domain-containing protein n=1 Tax=Ficus carica TaxID=3494 RepID=A0AA88DAC0_FICCA|nr:hypothetical protein TIFTF001_003387 [Ficus carica]
MSENVAGNLAGEMSSGEKMTPFAGSGCLSTMSFWWLNPLMKKGKKKVLQEEDIPRLREQDRARTLYEKFSEELWKRKPRYSSDCSSVLSTIFFIHWREILVSDIFALIKVLTLASNPLFIGAFIRIVEGDSMFRYEGYLLTFGLFIAKIFESVSERQWCYAFSEKQYNIKTNKAQ